MKDLATTYVPYPNQIREQYEMYSGGLVREITTLTLKRKHSVRTFSKHEGDTSKMCRSTFVTAKGSVVTGVISLNMLNRIIVADLPRRKKKQMKNKLKC